MKKFTIILLFFVFILSACNKQIDETRRPEFSIEPGINNPIPSESSKSSDGLVTIQYIPVTITHRAVNDEYKEHWLNYIRENCRIFFGI